VQKPGVRCLVLLAGVAGAGWGVPAAGGIVSIAASRNATLYETMDGSLANGAGEHLFIGRNSGGQARRALLWFDLAGIVPQDAIVQSVSLRVHVSSASDPDPRDVGVHRVLTDWGEGASVGSGTGGQGGQAQSGDATWLHTFYSDSFWTNPGGDFAGAASAVTTFAAGGGGGAGLGFVAFSGAGLLADVQAWLDTPSSNFGWALLGDEDNDGSARRLDSRHFSDPSLRPTLIVMYTVIPAPGAATAGVLLLCAHASRRRRRHAF
jgi:hypothetical protein